MCISMKKFFTVIFLSFVMVSAVILAGCTEIGHSAESAKISVVATIFPC